MSLMDQAREEAAKQGGEVAAPAKAEGVKKSHGAEYQRKQKQERYEGGLKLKAELEAKKVVLSPESAEYIAKLCKKPGTGQSFGGLQTPLIYRLFGDTPKVGQKITALEVFQKTRKGYNEFKQQVKKWVDKNVAVVVYDEKTDPNVPVWILKEVKQLPPKAVPAAEV